MKRLCTIIFLVSISILAYSQTTIRVEGSPALIDLKPDGTYCYTIDPENYPQSEEFTLQVEKTTSTIAEGYYVEKSDSLSIIALETGGITVELKKGEYKYIVSPEGMPKRSKPELKSDLDILNEE